jgi:hypothetical protein
MWLEKLEMLEEFWCENFLQSGHFEYHEMYR